MASLVALHRVFLLLGSLIVHTLNVTWLYVWDAALDLLNLFLPNRPVGHVVPKGEPGFAGNWPAYVPPSIDDSRSPCPALNTMANHGIIPRDGKRVAFAALVPALTQTYRISPPFARRLAQGAARLLGRDFATGTLDLADVCAHNVIEHDASFTREDVYKDADQSAPCAEVAEDLLASGTGPEGRLRVPDMSRVMGRRRAQCKSRNPQYSLTLGQKLGGSSNAAQILNVFGGDVADLRAFLLEERLPEGWEPRVRHRMGLTMAELNRTLLRVELGIREEVDGSLDKLTAHRKTPVEEAAAY